MTLTIIVAAILTILVLGVGGAMTTVGPWYRALRKPSWNPPDWIFGPAWTLILGLAAWAGVLAWTQAPGAGGRVIVGALFGVNIALHMLWSPLFFNLRRPDWALIEVPFLWLSIVGLIIGVTACAGWAGYGLISLKICRPNPKSFSFMLKKVTRKHIKFLIMAGFVLPSLIELGFALFPSPQ